MIPAIVIVGRPNVGKSSLLNMLAGRRISIVDETAGVTRDRVVATAQLPIVMRGQTPRTVELIDTGGYGVEDAQQLTSEIERQIARGLDQADLVLFVVDGQAGVVPLDQVVAKYIRRAHRDHPDKTVLLVINKVDAESREAQAYEAMQLGFGEPVLVSAMTGHNKFELIDRLHKLLPEPDENQPAPTPIALDDDDDQDGDETVKKPRDYDPAVGIRLAIVGKRNAGKSTLVNALAGSERVIVSDVEGTTRDAVDVRIEDPHGQIFTVIDTAGIRKRKSVKEDVEYYAMHRALRSIRRADVCFIVIDATLPVSQVDKRLSGEILKHFVPTVIVVNKWDLAEEKSTQQAFMEYLDKELVGLSFTPIVFMSAKHDEGVEEALALAVNLFQQASHRVGTGELNQVFKKIAEERGPSSKGGKRGRIYYVTQIATNPPTLMCSVNSPEIFEANNYQRFLLNRLRDELPYAEVPIKLLFRGKDRKDT